MKKLKIAAIILLLLVIAAGGVYVYARYIEPNRLIVRTEEYTGDVKEKLTIVQFTDTHFKEEYPAEKAERIVNLINEQEPDIVVFSGDLMDNYAKYPQLEQELPNYLKKITATYGKYAVYGNHDYGGGASRVYETIMEESGFIVLKNDVQELPEIGVAIIGVDDFLFGKGDLTSSDVDLQPYQMMILHEPDFLNQMKTDTIDLTLSGHTHGGQVYLPFLNMDFLPAGGQLYRKGLYEISDTSSLYVSSGIGTTYLTLRFQNPPEIIVHHITPR